MALKTLQPGFMPLGQFDAVDSELTSFLGGECCALTYVTTESQPGVSQSGIDQAAYDQFDGYINVSASFKRPAVSKNFNGTVLDGYKRPLCLSDDGITGYGTLFGVILGGTVGQTSYGATSSIPASAKLGPHTAAASGKITMWDKPGMYAVSLDATDTTSSTGLQPTNTSLVGGDKLYFTTAGLLTPNASASIVTGLNGVGVVVAHLIEFNTNGSLVTTPNYLVAALNSPSGNVSSQQPRAFAYATIYFDPPMGNSF